MDIIIDVVGILGLVLVAFGALRRLLKQLRGAPKLGLSERWIAITGCDSGIGKGVMQALIAANARVIACTYTQEGYEAAIADGAKHVLRFDLADEQAIRAASEQIQALTGGRLWALVHNAGMVQPGFVEFLTMDVFRRVLEVNYFAVVRLTQALIPALKRAQGRLVIVSSVDGLVSLAGNAPYDSAKFAVEAFADAVRLELSFWGVEVSVINPSTMKTPLAMSFFELNRKSWAQMNDLNPDGEWKEHFTPAWLDTYIERGQQQLERIAQDPQNTIEHILHALQAQHPHHRYLSGAMARTVFYALWKMPEEWSFAIKKNLIDPRPENIAR